VSGLGNSLTPTARTAGTKGKTTMTTPTQALTTNRPAGAQEGRPMTPEVTSTEPTPTTTTEPRAALKAEQAALQRAFDENPFPTLATIDDLKRQKLRIRDALYQLERQCHPAAVSWRAQDQLICPGGQGLDRSIAGPSAAIQGRASAPAPQGAAPPQPRRNRPHRGRPPRSPPVAREWGKEVSRSRAQRALPWRSVSHHRQPARAMPCGTGPWHCR
jgi:hypothetical protein